MVPLKNISVASYKKALEKLGLNCIRAKGGHEVWARADLFRSIVFSVQFSDVNAGQVLSNCRTLGITPDDFLKIVEGLISNA